MEVQTKIITGIEPPSWDREIIYIANLLSLFFGNEEQTDVLRKEVGSIDSYGSRLIPILNLIYNGADNILVLEREPSDLLVRYFEKELNLKIPTLKILSHDEYVSVGNNQDVLSDHVQQLLSFLKNHSANWVDGYVTDRHLLSITKSIKKKTISNGEGSIRGNNKLLLYEFIKSKRLPSFDWYVGEDMSAINHHLKELKKKGYMYGSIKAQIGASGIGMIKVDLNKDFPYQNIPDYMFYEGPCLIEGWLDESLPNVKYGGSPSVQILLKDDEIYLYDITEQILSTDSIHEGNIASPEFYRESSNICHELIHQAEIVSHWLSEQGYRGTASVDFHLIKRNGEVEVRVCEINARVTGATYPSFLARHFMPEKAWLMRNIRFSPTLKGGTVIKTLNEKKLLYRPGEKQGVIPFNLNYNDEGLIEKGQFVILAQNKQDTIDLLQNLNKIPSMQGDFDRD